METSLEVRFNNAMKAIRKSGIVARKNVMGCCRSCINLELADNVPVIWHYGGQGNRTTISGDHATFSSMYFNHDNLVANGELTSAGQKVLEAFEANGIEVDWDKSASKCLEVVLK